MIELFSTAGSTGLFFVIGNCLGVNGRNDLDIDVVGEIGQHRATHIRAVTQTAVASVDVNKRRLPTKVVEYLIFVSSRRQRQPTGFSEDIPNDFRSDAPDNQSGVSHLAHLLIVHVE